MEDTGTAATPYLPKYTIYWGGDEQVIEGSYPMGNWFDSPPVCSCEATWAHNIWTHWYRLLTMNKKVWRV